MEFGRHHVKRLSFTSGMLRMVSGFQYRGDAYRDSAAAFISQCKRIKYGRERDAAMKQELCYYCMNPLNDQEICPVCGTMAGTTGDSEHKPFYLMPGSTLHGGRYLVGRVLGAGGFGITYIGFDTVLRFRVAIKEYFLMNYATRSPDDPTVTMHSTSYLEFFDRGKERFLHEAQILASMDKVPAIVDVKDFFEENGTAYIVMEFIQGTTLKNMVEQRGGRIRPEELFPLIEPLFRAMVKVHEKGLIHRDIAPDNLMLENGDIRLLDFGCAREATTGSETMTIMLKPGFAPLEQYDGRGQGPWTDVYALCATLYYCLTGEVPPPAINRFRQDSLTPPSALGVKLLPQTEQALLTGMAVEPENRRISISQLHSAIYGELNQMRPSEVEPKRPGTEGQAPQEREQPPVTPNTAPQQEAPVQQQGYTQMPQPAPSQPQKDDTPIQGDQSRKTGGEGPKKPVLLWALIPVLVLLLGTGVFAVLRPKSDVQKPAAAALAEGETETEEAEATETNDTTATENAATQDSATSPNPGTTSNQGDTANMVPAGTQLPTSALATGSDGSSQSDEETESTPLVGASGFGAVPADSIDQLPESITCETWKTDRTVQGIAWNTDTLDTFYVCYSSSIVSYDLDGKMKEHCNDVGDAQLFSLAYYDGYVVSAMRSSGNSRLKLRIYDADTLELKNSVDLNDIKARLSEDKDTYGEEDLTPFLGGVMVSPAIGSQKKEKLYICYNVYLDEEDTIGLNDYQLIFEYDFRKCLKAKDSTKVNRILKVDVDAVEYGIQTLVYDRGTKNIWCGVHKGLSDFPLYCIDGKDRDEKLALVKNQGLKGWDCAPAEYGLCSLGSDQYYVPEISKSKHAVTVTLRRVSQSELSDLS